MIVNKVETFKGNRQSFHQKFQKKICKIKFNISNGGSPDKKQIRGKSKAQHNSRSRNNFPYTGVLKRGSIQTGTQTWGLKRAGTQP